MSADLSRTPLDREFVLLEKGWQYWGKGNEFGYYYEDHPSLDSIVRILQNHGLVYEITSSNVQRYVITEALADYLKARPT